MHEFRSGQPPITSTRDLTELCEVEDSESGSFLRSTFAFVDSQDTVWFGQALGVRKFDLTVEDLRRSLREIADDTVYPEVTPGLTIVAADNELKSLYIKRPKLLCLDNPDEAQLLPRLLADEARTLECLQRCKHKNLVRYYGCISRRGKIVGIALEKYDVILQYRFEDDPREFNIDACVSGIRAGMKHLHSLGFAHNDLNPMNIALDKDDQPVILDFGSCRRFGEMLLSGGTPGWMDEDYSTSSPHHDESALRKVEAWLRKNEIGRMKQARALEAQTFMGCKLKTEADMDSRADVDR